MVADAATRPTARYVQPDPFSTQMRDQTQAGALAGTAGFAANLVHGFNDAVARSAVGQVSGAIGGQVLPAAPTVAANLLEPSFADPTKGNVLGNAVFPDGPSRYGYAQQAPLGHTDPAGLLTLKECVILALCWLGEEEPPKPVLPPEPCPIEQTQGPPKPSAPRKP